MRYNTDMKLSLQTWNGILLGPFVLSLTYLSQPSSSADIGSRAVAIGIIFYLIIPVLVLLTVDVIKLRQYLLSRKI